MTTSPDDEDDVTEEKKTDTAQAKGYEGNPDFLLKIPLELRVEIGGTDRQIKDIFSFKKGEILLLSENENDPVDLMVNNRLIARGKIIVEEGKYGLQITEIKSRMERIGSLK